MNPYTEPTELTTMRNLILSLAMLTAGTANAVTITSGFGGIWWDPEAPGQGFVVEIVDGAEGPEVGLIVFTFGSDGKPFFMVGQGPVQKNRSQMELIRTEFVPPVPVGPVPPLFIRWGVAEISFDDCSTGTLVLTDQSGFAAAKIRVGTGTFRLQPFVARLAKSCTGGIADDLPPATPPRGFEQILDLGVGTAATEYTERPGLAELRVELRDVAVGVYEVFGDNLPLGFIRVGTGTAGRTRGEFRLRSPVSGSAELLDFNPRGVRLHFVAPNGDLILAPRLSTDLVALSPPTQILAPSIEGAVLEAQFDSSTLQPIRGVLSAAQFLFSTRVEHDEELGISRLELRAEGMSPGTYDIAVDGVIRGQMTVRSVGNGQSSGTLLFQSPVVPGTVNLDFDPIGRVVSVVDNTVALFSVEISR